MDQPAKLKISTDFIITKVFLIGFLGILLLLLTDYRKTEADTVGWYGFIFFVLSILLYYLFSRPGIYYDEKFLYVMKGTKLNMEIPLENIQSIKYSVIGFGRAGYSYKIKYLDAVNEMKSVRIFPKVFSNPISKFIKCVEKHNPRVRVSNWSFGINELFD